MKRIKNLQTLSSHVGSSQRSCGVKFSNGINFNEIVVLNEKKGRPFIKLIKNTKKKVEKKFKRKKYKISLSLSDENNYAVAFVTISL